MAWVAFSKGEIIGFGDRKAPTFFEEVIEYECWDTAENAHKTLAAKRRNSAESIDLARVDVNQPIETAHAVKAMEAIAYKFMKAPAEACINCQLYADDCGISLEDAVDIVWQKHQSFARNESQRTQEKAKVRENYSSKGS